MLILIHLGNMNRGLKSQLMKTSLLPQEEDQLGNQNANRKHHSEAVRPHFAEEKKGKEIDC